MAGLKGLFCKGQDARRWSESWGEDRPTGREKSKLYVTDEWLQRMTAGRVVPVSAVRWSKASIPRRFEFTLGRRHLKYLHSRLMWWFWEFEEVFTFSGIVKIAHRPSSYRGHEMVNICLITQYNLIQGVSRCVLTFSRGTFSARRRRHWWYRAPLLLGSVTNQSCEQNYPTNYQQT